MEKYTESESGSAFRPFFSERKRFPDIQSFTNYTINQNNGNFIRTIN